MTDRVSRYAVQATVARKYSILRCLHHISAALRFSLDIVRVETARVLYLDKNLTPIVVFHKKVRHVFARCFWLSIHGIVIPCLFIHFTTFGSRSVDSAQIALDTGEQKVLIPGGSYEPR